MYTYVCAYFIIILLTGLQNSQADVKEYFIARAEFQAMQWISREPRYHLRQTSPTWRYFYWRINKASKSVLFLHTQKCVSIDVKCNAVQAHCAQVECSEKWDKITYQKGEITANRRIHFKRVRPSGLLAWLGSFSSLLTYYSLSPPCPHTCHPAGYILSLTKT